MRDQVLTFDQDTLSEVILSDNPLFIKVRMELYASLNVDLKPDWSASVRLHLNENTRYHSKNQLIWILLKNSSTIKIKKCVTNMKIE